MKTGTRKGSYGPTRDTDRVVETAFGYALKTTPLTPMACMAFTPMELAARLRAIRRRIRAECPDAIGRRTKIQVTDVTPLRGDDR